MTLLMGNIYTKYGTLLLLLVTLLVSSTTVAQTTYLSQNFAGSGPYTSKAPTSAQFDTIYTQNGLTLGLTPGQGYVEFPRTGSGSGRVVRSTNFSPTPATMHYQVRVTVPLTQSVTANVATFNIGQNLSSSNNALPSDQDLFAKTSINFLANNAYLFRRTGNNPFPFNSSSYTGSVLLTWVINNQSTKLPYRTPLGTIDSIRAKTYDLWIGNTLFLKESPRISTSEVVLTDISFRMDDGIGTIRLSDFLIRDVSGTLPVNLTYFNAQAAGGEVALAWETALERDSKEFIVQRSTDLKEFGDIGKVAAMGQTEGRQAYRFVHTAPALGTNYYRLRMVDQDGSYEYSKVKDVINRPNEPVLLVSPNPVSNHSIRLRTFMLDNTSLKLSNILGQDIPFRTEDIGNNTVELIPFSNLSPGLYIVSAQRDGIRVHSQLIVP